VRYCIHPKLRIFVMYRPPLYNDIAASYVTTLVDCLCDTVNNRYSNIIMGDFNLPKINWNSLRCPNDSVSKPLLNFLIESGFSQLVSFPTLLDLLLTDYDHLICSIESCPPLGHSDHVCIKFSMNFSYIDRNVTPGSVTDSTSNSAIAERPRCRVC